MKHSSIIIIGSGPAGYTAAIYAARAAHRPILFTGAQQGGQLTITTEVENYPGFAQPIQGPWLMDQMKTQAENFGVGLILQQIVEVDFKVYPFKLISDSGEVYTSDSVIIATGAQAKCLGLESERELRGYGVSACATCDGFFFRDQEVMVIGGGNTAAEEALFLSKFAKRVILVHRRDQLRAEKILQQRLFSQEKITILWNKVVEEILKKDTPKAVSGVSLKDVVSGESSVHPIDGVFVAIGHKPATEVFSGQLKLRSGGYIITQPRTTKTVIDGIFAAGDVTDDRYHQAVTAAAMGCMAAIDADSFLSQRS